MNISIFYFSGTGNTRWASEEFTQILSSMNHQVTLYSLETTSIWDSCFLQEIYSSTNMFRIAYPIYGSTLPPFMWRFLEELQKIAQTMPNLTIKQGFTLTTVALFSGDGSLVPKKVLRSAKIHLIGAMNSIQVFHRTALPSKYHRYHGPGKN